MNRRAFRRATAAAGNPFFLRVAFQAPDISIDRQPEFMIDPDSVKLPLPTQKERGRKPPFERKQLCICAGTLDLTSASLQVARGTCYGTVWQVNHAVGPILDRRDELGLRKSTVNSDHRSTVPSLDNLLDAWEAESGYRAAKNNG